MQLTITRILTLLVMALPLGACGMLDEEARLEIEMYGVAQAPSTATGDRDPDFQNYTIESIALSRDGAEPLELLTEAQTFRVVDRPQLLLRRVSDDLVGQTFTGIIITVAPDVTGGEGQKHDYAFTLSQPTLTLVETFTIEEKATRLYAVKAQWGNTLSNEAMTEPTFSFGRP